MNHDIDWINSTKPSVNYSEQAMAEYKQGEGDGIRKYTKLFECEHNVNKGNDIGGLIVYSDSCVYDYENFVGWVR